MNRSHTFARLRSLAWRRPILAFLLAITAHLATPWPPAPWEVTLGAQTYTHNTTTLAAAQTATDTTISLTSAAAASGSSFGAVQIGQFLMVDQEFEQITGTTATSTIFQVQRRSARTSHASGSSVFIGVANTFQATAPPMGTCVQASQPKFWIVNGGAGAAGIGGDAIGNIYTCSTNGFWQQSSAPWLNGSVNSGNGATVTLTAGQAGTTVLFDRAAGIVYTLPPPVPGMTFDFVQTVTTTSNSAEIATSGASIFIQGIVHIGISGGATGSDWACNGTTHIAIKQNGTTSGGILGGRLHFIAISSTIWQVDGLTIGSGTEVTPCSTTT